jgi:hypothetical protein
MDIEVKCKILEEFVREHILHDKFNDEEVETFLNFNDLGIPLAQSVSYNLATLTEEGEDLVNETWLDFCVLVEVDSKNDYEDLEDILEDDED